MVDVVFLLVIFFMVSTTFITVESQLPVSLPSAQTSQASRADLPTVTINRDGGIFLAGSAVPEEELVAALRQVVEAEGSGTVAFRADQSVPYGVTVRIYDLIRQAGARNIAIVTEN